MTFPSIIEFNENKHFCVSSELNIKFQTRTSDVFDQVPRY